MRSLNLGVSGKRAAARLAFALALGLALPLALPSALSAETNAAPQGEAARIAALETELARQTQIATNARQSLEALRAEMKLKDELLNLGRERNAELYKIASEIADKYVRNRSTEPLLQYNRVRMENLRQSYEDRLRAARIHETTLPPSVQDRMNKELNERQDAAQPPSNQN